MVQIKKETTSEWEYKVGNNGNVANFVVLWKPRLLFVESADVGGADD